MKRCCAAEEEDRNQTDALLNFPILDSFRTFCRSLTAEIREMFEGLRELKQAG
jgi:hypothetical protein